MTQKSKTVLTLDTATEFCSAALQKDGRVYRRALKAPQKHAALILGYIDELLREAGCDRKDIDLIGVGLGPGSFTGVRIAASVAQGLALGLDVPVFGADDLRMLALQAARRDAGCEFALAAIDARMSEVYFALYRKKGDGSLECVLSPAVAPMSDAAERISSALRDAGAGASASLAAAGTGIALLQRCPEKNFEISRDFEDLTDEDLLFPDAASLLTIAASGEITPLDPAEIEPLYCRNEVTWKKIGEQ